MRLVKDKRYGAVNTSVEGNWDGIIGELVRRVSEPRRWSLYCCGEPGREERGVVEILGRYAHILG